jgi:putative Holliday junction resolvase
LGIKLMRVLAVDPGDVRIGLALSDPTGLIARPLRVIHHTARAEDAEVILQIAHEHDVGRIVVGLALDQDGEVGPQARKSLRLIECLRSVGTLPIEPWDESGSTQAAHRGNLRDPMLDARAAAVLLQEYLNAQAG